MHMMADVWFKRKVMSIPFRCSSQWLLNGAAVLAVATVTLCAPVVAQNTPRRIDHNTVEDPASALTLDIGGVVYNVPVNRLDTLVEPDKTVPTEVAGGFSITGLLPNFEMRNAENAHEFAGTDLVLPRSLASTCWASRGGGTSFGLGGRMCAQVDRSDGRPDFAKAGHLHLCGGPRGS